MKNHILNFLIYITLICLVLTSFVLINGYFLTNNLTSSEKINQSLYNSNIYNKSEEEINQRLSNSSEPLEKLFLDILKDYLTAFKIKQIFEENTPNLQSYLRGEDDLYFDIPYSDFQNYFLKNLQSKTQTYIDSGKFELCSQKSQDFCISNEVWTGKTSISDYFEINSLSDFDKINSNGALGDMKISDKISLQELIQNFPELSTLESVLSKIKNIYLQTQQALLSLLFIWLGLFLLLTLLILFSKYNFLRGIRLLFQYTSTILLLPVFVLIAIMLISQKLFQENFLFELIGLHSVSIFLKEIIIIGLVLAILSLIIKFANKDFYVRLKNSKIKEYEPQTKSANTLDTIFQEKIKSQQKKAVSTIYDKNESPRNFIREDSVIKKRFNYDTFEKGEDFPVDNNLEKYMDLDSK